MCFRGPPPAPGYLHFNLVDNLSMLPLKRWRHVPLRQERFMHGVICEHKEMTVLLLPTGNSHLPIWDIKPDFKVMESFLKNCA